MSGFVVIQLLVDDSVVVTVWLAAVKCSVYDLWLWNIMPVVRRGL